MGLAAGYPQLTWLNLYHSPQVIDEGLGALAPGYPQLSWLNLSCGSEVTDGRLGKLAAGCPQLSSSTSTAAPKRQIRNAEACNVLPTAPLAQIPQELLSDRRRSGKAGSGGLPAALLAQPLVLFPSDT